MRGIQGKVVAITGASGGIGEATALLLAERGAKLALGARRSDRLAALAARTAELGSEAVWARTDATRREDLSDLVELACDRFGKLDVLISNAGIEARTDDRAKPDRTLQSVAAPDTRWLSELEPVALEATRAAPRLPALDRSGQSGRC